MSTPTQCINFVFCVAFRCRDTDTEPLLSNVETVSSAFRSTNRSICENADCYGEKLNGKVQGPFSSFVFVDRASLYNFVSRTNLVYNFS